MALHFPVFFSFLFSSFKLGLLDAFLNSEARRAFTSDIEGFFNDGDLLTLFLLTKS